MGNKAGAQYVKTRWPVVSMQARVAGQPSCANGLSFGTYVGKCPAYMKAVFLVLLVNGVV
jgi:hypothetical protein